MKALAMLELPHHTVSLRRAVVEDVTQLVDLLICISPDEADPDAGRVAAVAYRGVRGGYRLTAVSDPDRAVWPTHLAAL